MPTICRDMRHHALVIVTHDSVDATAASSDANDPEHASQQWERYIRAVRSAVHEYVVLAQQLQQQPASTQPSHARPTTISDSENDDDIDTHNSTTFHRRLLLSVNVLTPGNARATQQLGMARPVAVTQHNAHLVRDICTQLDACRTPSPTTSNTNADSDSTAASEQLTRALEWFADSPFAVSVIAPADALPGLGTDNTNNGTTASDALVTALERLHDVQFVLLRAEDERPDRAARTIVRLSRAVQRSANPKCAIRQVDSSAIELRGIVKEWLARASPSVTSTLTVTGAAAGVSSIDALRLMLEIRSNYVLYTTVGQSLGQPLHVGLQHLEILHVAPLASVHPSVLVGCPLHAIAPSSPFPKAQSDVINDVNTVRLATLARFLETEQCGIVLRCTLAKRREFFFFVPAPAAAASSQVQFLLFRVASAEEVLLPPLSGTNSVVHAATDTESDVVRAAIAAWRSIPRENFNPFQYESGLVLVLTDKTATAPTTTKMATSNSVTTSWRAAGMDVGRRNRSDLLHTKAKRKPNAVQVPPAAAAAVAYAPIATAKRKKLL